MGKYLSIFEQNEEQKKADLKTNKSDWITGSFEVIINYFEIIYFNFEYMIYVKRTC
jgi:hypothetical protein